MFYKIYCTASRESRELAHALDSRDVGSKESGAPAMPVFVLCLRFAWVYAAWGPHNELSACLARINVLAINNKSDIGFDQDVCFPRQVTVSTVFP